MTKLKRKKSKAKIFLIILIVVLVLTGAGIGGYFLLKKPNNFNAHEHTYTADYGRYTHYQRCTECGDIKDEAAHTATEACDECDFHVTQGLVFAQVENGYEIVSWEEITEARVYLPETHEGLPVVSIADSALVGLYTATLLDVPASVVRIGKNAFSNCANLTDLVVPFLGSSAEISQTESENTLAYYAEDATLKNLTILGGTLEKNALNNNTTLESVTVKANVEYVSDYAFRGCQRLRKLVFANESLLEKIGDFAFEGCWALSLDLSKFSNLTEIGVYSFNHNHSLASLALPSKITTIPESAFSSCFSLTNVVVPNSVTEIHHAAFADCVNLQTFTFPEYVKALPTALFRGATSLKDVYMPKTAEQTNASYFFDGLSSEGVIPNVHITGTFDDFIKMSPAFSDSDYKLIQNGKTVTHVEIPAEAALPDGVFSNCVSLESVTFSDGVTRISGNAFSGCVNITGITLPASMEDIRLSFYAAKIQTINYLGSVAAWCKNADGILGAFVETTDEGTTAPNVLLNGREVVDLVIPEDTTGIDVYAYCGFKNLKTLSIDKSLTYNEENYPTLYDTVSEASIDNLTKVECPVSFSCYVRAETLAFNYADTANLKGSTATGNPVKYLTVCEGVTKINNFFNYNASLVEVVFPSSLQEIHNSFDKCTDLTGIDLPEGLLKITESFNYCTKLFDITLPSSLEICTGAFFGAPVYQVTIPAGCTFEAFNYCTNLVKLILEEDSQYYNFNYFMLGSSNLIEICDDTDLFDAKGYIKARETDYQSSHKALKSIYSSKDGGALINETDTGALYKLTDGAYEIIGLKSGATKIDCDYILGETFTVSEHLTNATNYTVTEIRLGDGCTAIPNNAFYNYYNLEKVYLGKNVLANVETGFDNCAKLSGLEISAENSVYATHQNILFNKGKTVIKFIPKALGGDIVLPNTLTSIDENQFMGTLITSLHTGNGVRFIGMYAFSRCENLKSVTIGASVVWIDYGTLYLSKNVETIKFVVKSGWTRNGASIDSIISDTSYMLPIMSVNASNASLKRNG